MKQRNTILIVDDKKINRTVLKNIFYKQYRVLEASNAEDALTLFHNEFYNIALVLLNVVLPNKEGYLVLDKIHHRNWKEKIPVVVMTTIEERENVIKLLDMGVSDIILQPFNTSIVQKRVCNMIEQQYYKNYYNNLIHSKVEMLQKANESMVRILNSVIEHRNRISTQQVHRLHQLTKLLFSEVAKKYSDVDLTEDRIASMSSACALHDIGKVLIPDSILNKKGKLTQEEFDIIKTHTEKGIEVLSQLGISQEDSFFRDALDVCRYHHERWDGKGYPEGLRGDEIPLCAQVAGLIDCYDALTSTRPYQPAVTHDVAVKMILNQECGMFSKKLLHCFKKVHEKYAFLFQDGIDLGKASENGKISPYIVEQAGKSAEPEIPYDCLNKITSLKYLDSIILVVDLARDFYERIYPIYTEFQPLQSKGSYSQTFQKFVGVYLHPDDRESLLLGYYQYLKDLKKHYIPESSMEIRVMNNVKSGYSWYQISMVSLQKVGGNASEFMIVLKNIHEMKNLKQKNSRLVNILSEITENINEIEKDVSHPMLHHLKTLASGNINTAEDQLKYLLNIFNDTVVEYNLENNSVYYSENFVNKFGSSIPRTSDEWKEWVRLVVHQDDFAAFHKNFTCLMQGKQADMVEFRYKNNEGKYVWCQKRATVIFNDEQMPVKIIGLMMDISYYKNEYARLQEKSERDLMTGLYNKTTVQFLIEEFLQESKGKKKHVLVVFDIDNFKQINDTKGHLTGDQAIKSLAKRIISCTRQNDIVGRIGGDEFVLLMKNMSDKKSVKNKIKRLMETVNKLHGKSDVTVSMGIAIFPDHGVTYDDLFCHADEALYDSKRCGKKQWKFYSS